MTMRWIENFTDSVDMNLSKLWDTVKDRGAWWATVHGVAKMDMTVSLLRITTNSLIHSTITAIMVVVIFSFIIYAIKFLCTFLIISLKSVSKSEIYGIYE